MVQPLYPNEVHVPAPTEDVSASSIHVHQMEILSAVPVFIINVVVVTLVTVPEATILVFA